MFSKFYILPFFVCTLIVTLALAPAVKLTCFDALYQVPQINHPEPKTTYEPFFYDVFSFTVFYQPYI